MAKKRKTSPTADQARTLTDAEWAVMDVVWMHEPCAAGTVQEALADTHGWAYSTVKTTMDRMVAKGLLGTHSIRNLNLYSSLITRDSARRCEVRKTLRRAFDGAMTPLLQFLVEGEELSDDELDELRRLITRAKWKR